MPATADADRYTIISADCHAGGSHAAYREYLDPEYLDDFDAWRNKYKNPYKDLGDNRRLRNWDNEMRNGQQEEDGIVGEVVFPNTVPPFFPSFVLFAKPPTDDEYEHRLAGIRAHNRWLVDWCNEFPERRAGIGQIFLNDVDDAIDDVKWIKEHGLRGGILLPNIAPDVKWVKPLYDRCYDPLWEVLPGPRGPGQRAQRHRRPRLRQVPGVDAPLHQRGALLLAAPVRAADPVGRVRAVPPPQVRDDRGRLRVGAAAARAARRDDPAASATRAPPARSATATSTCCRRDATEYFHQNCWMGVSQPGEADAEARHQIGLDRFMWGSDYPHDEGTYPYTREHLRARFPDVPEDEMRKILAGNAAKLYDFDLDKLAPLAAKFGPTVDEVAHAHRRDTRQDPRPAVGRHGPAGDQVSDTYGAIAGSGAVHPPEPRRTRSSSSTTRRRACGASPSTGPRSATR